MTLNEVPMPPVCREEILPLLAQFGITPEAAEAYGIPEPVLDDIADLVPLLPSSFRLPEVEVDEDDGMVVARWCSEDMRESFSLTFPGLGTVTGYHSRASADPAWKLPLDDRIRLSAKLSGLGIAALVQSHDPQASASCA
jgi:hypothetical protein